MLVSKRVNKLGIGPLMTMRVKLTAAEKKSEPLKARIKKLEDRLEVYSIPDKNGKRMFLDIGSCDGIGCRNETIKILDKRIKELEDEICG